MHAYIYKMRDQVSNPHHNTDTATVFISHITLKGTTQPVIGRKLQISRPKIPSGITLGVILGGILQPKEKPDEVRNTVLSWYILMCIFFIGDTEIPGYSARLYRCPDQISIRQGLCGFCVLPCERRKV
jgi:hypothetical protein